MEPESPLIKAPSTLFDGWPIRRHGLYMGAWSDIIVTFAFRRLDAEGVDTYMRELDRSIAERPDRPFGVMMCIPPGGDSEKSDHDQLRRQGEILKKHKEKLGRTTAGFAMVTESIIARSAMRLIFTLAPPPYKTHVCKTPTQAVQWLSGQMSTPVREGEISRAAEQVFRQMAEGST